MTRSANKNEGIFDRGDAALIIGDISTSATVDARFDNVASNMTGSVISSTAWKNLLITSTRTSRQTAGSFTEGIFYDTSCQEAGGTLNESRNTEILEAFGATPQIQ